MKDEFAFIANISPTRTYQPSLQRGIGDDAAVYRGSSEMDEVICVDTFVEGIHFKKDTMSLRQLGKRVLAVNVSDLAAMGAIPAYYLVSVAVPSLWEENELLEVYLGMEELAKVYKMDLIGGDTVFAAGGGLVLSVTVIGRVEKGKALYRDEAKPGNVVFLTGQVGSSAAGLSLLLEKGLDGPFNVREQHLVRAHQEPSPHVDEGRLLVAFRERVALNDVSDGIASELNELAEASNVRITVEADLLPLHDSLKAYPRQKQLEWGLFGGEDFVLVGTVASEHAEALKEIFYKHGKQFHEIGFVEEGKPSVYLKEGDNITPLQKHGYNHFRNRR
ncbi:thiamine-phosphate kinase [bacterium LRH843]|nr:thiamine-phosphate kinase [bacterium LRH843]